jgi:hypothetical protein
MTRTLSAVLGLAVLVAAGAAALSLPSSAAAKGTKCGEEIVADWFDNGRIDRIYPLHCYEEAIDAIPSDIRDYADAADVIHRALESALNGHLAPGGPDPTPGTRPVGSGTGNGTDGAGNPQAVGPDVNSSGPSSVPIPLLILGGISLALVAAGALGYVSRRRQTQSEDDGSDENDPTS